MKMTSLKRIVLLIVLAVLTGGQAKAQLVKVEPGVKGELPAAPELPKAAEGTFGALSLRNITVESRGVFSYYDYFIAPELQYPDASALGGESYTIQYHESGSSQWKTLPSDYIYYSRSVSVCDQSFVVDRLYMEQDRSMAWPISYRLIMNGGPMDGYVSNEVEAEKPYNANLKVSIGYSQPNLIYAGYNVSSHFVDVARIADTSKSEEAKKDFINVPRGDLNITYRWYLRNPNTYEMTLIEGATGDTYTPTRDQVGYELVSQIVGSYNNSTFKTTHCEGTIKLAILASIHYQGRDGFIINTEYVLPNPEKDLYIAEWPEESEESPYGNKKPISNLKTLKPGQYAVNMDIKDYAGITLNYGENPYYLCSWSRRWDGYHEFFLFGSDEFPVRINVQKDGTNVKLASVDVIGKNIEGKYSVIETLTATEESDTIKTNLLVGDYLFRAHAVDGTMETYFRNAAVWDEARSIKLTSYIYWGKFSDETYAFTINLQPSLGSLNGNSTITGTISIPGGAKARTRAAGDGVNCTVYLKDKASGNIVAKTPAESNGDYTFLNVPVGEYVVVPDFVGYKASNALSASVTQENQVVNVDCALQATDVLPPAEGVLAGDANGDEDINADDVEAVAKYIMLEDVDEFYEDNADANNDGYINIADIVCIVNLF